MTDRAIIAEFFRHAGGATRLHSLTVVSDYTCNDGRILRSKKTYDVEWSHRYGYYLFHNSGSGGSERVSVMGAYFTSGPAIVRETKSTWCHRPDSSGRKTHIVRKRNRTRRLTCLPEHIDLRPGHDLLDWLKWENVEQDAVWCSECKDWLRGDYLCEHTWWCDKIGWYSTPSDRCGHDREECQS